MIQHPIPPLISDDLARVQAIIQERIAAQPAVASVAEMHVDVPSASQIRAVIALLAARLGPSFDPRVLHAAAAVELIHIATSVHDKLIDAGAMRRGEVVDHSRWRGDASLMVGDYMFALSASEMALAPDPRIIEYFSHAVKAIAEGELTPVTQISPPLEAIDQYLSAIGDKTAVLFGAAGRAGMVCGGGSPAETDAVGRFAYQVGLAHQIVEDSLAAEDNLRAGRITLPLIYAVEESGDRWLASVIDAKELDQADMQRVHHAIASSGSVERALGHARQAIERALPLLDIFPESPARQSLVELAQLFG